MGKISVLESFVLFLVTYVFALPAIILTSPITTVFEFFTILNPDFFRSKNTPANHSKKVLSVQQQVLKWNKDGRKGRMCTARPAWQTISVRNYEKSGMTQIHMDLEDIIEVDTRNMVVRVEPGMKMGTLTHKLLPQGWTIPVVPELVTLTVGGCICGAGLETSSHKYGMFADTPIALEVVLADGSLVHCSREENSDLFYAMHWSHGTLGFLVGVTFPLIPAKKYVKLEYIPTKSMDETIKFLQESKDNEFIEGILYDKNRAVVMHGHFVDKAPSHGQVNNVMKWYKPWFYKHVESFLSKSGRHTEYIPTREYYFRHQRSVFWEVSILFPYGNHPIFRYLLGWVLPVNIQILKFFLPLPVLDMILKRDHHIAQDFVLPITNLKKAMDFTHETAEVYPIWLCPVTMSPIPAMTHATGKEKELFVDVGIYGNARRKIDCPLKETVRKFEKFTIANKGFQGMCADNYLTKEEFEQMFDVRLYNEVRKKLKCSDAFPHAYDKISYIGRKI